MEREGWVAVNESGRVDFLPCRGGKAHVNVCHAAHATVLWELVRPGGTPAGHPISTLRQSLSKHLRPLLCWGTYFPSLSFSRERERERCLWGRWKERERRRLSRRTFPCETKSKLSLYLFHVNNLTFGSPHTCLNEEFRPLEFNGVPASH